jgi:hypothetical protein
VSFSVALGGILKWVEAPVAKGIEFKLEVQQEEKEDNVVQLITGGKEPPSTADNWLDELPIGAIFTVQDKLASDIRDPNYFNLGLFKIAERDGKVTYLQSLDNPKGMPVNPTRFCNRFTKYEEITGYVLAKEQEQERAQHERDRLQGEPGSPVPDVE